MCAGAIINARIPALYYGAKDEKAGCCGSVLNLFEERFGHKPRIYGGLLAEESRALLHEFFAVKRYAAIAAVPGLGPYIDDVYKQRHLFLPVFAKFVCQRATFAAWRARGAHAPAVPNQQVMRVRPALARE